jgi:integrase
MATVTAFIRISKKNIHSAKVRFRLRDGRDVQLFHVSDFEVNPSQWDTVKQEIKAKVVYDTDKRAEFNSNVADRKKLLLNIYDSHKDDTLLTSEWLEQEIDKSLHPEKYMVEVLPEMLMPHFDEYIKKAKLSDVRKNNLRVISRAFKRYELYQTKISGKSYYIILDDFTANFLEVFEEFMKNEHVLCAQYPDIYEAVPESRKPQMRGPNTISDMLTKVRTFAREAMRQKLIKSNPFDTFKVEECVYGTPYYISIEERNRLYKTNLRRHPKLAIQRDIFVFHCLIGCRVGDLYRMTKDNVINGAIEYIARKTKDGRPVTVRVPLNSIAKEILEKYNDYKSPKLLPYISEQKYNEAIKIMFLAARLRRIVTVVNPKTREEEKRKLNEIASTHLARRCFVGNLYKKVKDPNLVGALSGHKEGSKAFARYRDIDDDIKKELVDLLE